MSLQSAFENHAKGTKELEQRDFVKWCKDAGVVGKGFTANDADLVFIKHKQKHGRHLELKELDNLVEDVAQRKKCSKEEVEEMFKSAAQPVLHGTKAINNRFHDDKSTFTGVHAKGGPTTIDNVGLAGMTDRNKESNRRKS